MPAQKTGGREAKGGCYSVSILLAIIPLKTGLLKKVGEGFCWSALPISAVKFISRRCLKT